MEENRYSPQEVKRLFLNNGNTRFEYLKFIFTASQLQDERPFILLDQVYSQLGLTREDFKTKSFHSWLKRYRQRKPAGQGNLPKAVESEKVAPSVLPEVSPVKSESKGEIKDDFEFTDPSTRKKEDDVIIRYAQHEK